MKIKELEINDIRGIRHIKIEPQTENVVIFGPNGTGKSAVIDAIDFLLTGKISRLIGEGTKSLSVKEHGCHVDARDKLEDTLVRAKVLIDGKDIKIERSIKRPTTLKVKPKEHKGLVESCLKIADLGQHSLSRREILRFITAESGKRAKEIMSLLDLSNIENIRSTFVSIKNNAEEYFKHKGSNFEVAKNEICNLLPLEIYSDENSLKKVNELREVFRGSKIAELKVEKIKEGLRPYISGISEDALTKEQTENIIKSVRGQIEDKNKIAETESELKALLEEVRKKSELKQYSLYKKLFEAGISLVDESNVCPLCGRRWDEGSFKEYLTERIKQTEIAKETQRKIDELSSSLKIKIDLLKDNITNLLKACKQYGLSDIENKGLQEYLTSLDSHSETMLKPLEVFETGKWSALSLDKVFGSPLLEERILTPLEGQVKKVGEKHSKQQTAWDTLTKMEDRLKTYQKALKDKEDSEVFKIRAERLLEYFEKARDSVLEELYSSINKNFVEYYQEIHSEDEKTFTSKISHVESELLLEVDFYGRGMFPPHALHSEGHQDSMGLCLFLALNKYLTGDELKIIILDDVVMSIDRNHRRGICNLLKNSFPEIQFIITTHETAWAKQLKSEGIVKQRNMLHFLNWNISTGPIYELGKDLWDKIKEDLDKDDIPAAAAKLRRNAESFFEDICDLLSAKITYKGHHRWELGDFASAAISTYTGYIKKAKQNFQKMKNTEKLKELGEHEEKTKEIIKKSQVEQWIINANVHFNKLEEYGREDFEKVVEAFKNLFGLFICESCGATIALTESTGETPKATVSCNCGKIFWDVK